MEVLLNNLHASRGRISGTTICILIIIKRGWERAIYTLSVRRPHPFRIPLFYVYILTTDSTKHLLNLSNTELSEKNVLVKYSYNVDVNEYDNMTISKQQIALKVSVSRGVMEAR